MNEWDFVDCFRIFEGIIFVNQIERANSTSCCMKFSIMSETIATKGEWSQWNTMQSSFSSAAVWDLGWQ
jgi:hypothetical protein